MTVSAPEAGRHRGFDGWWLRNDAAEAFVIARPCPRLIAFRLVGRASPLHVSGRYEFFGVRTWFLEPVETEQSGLPARQPAAVVATAPGRINLVGGDERVTGLRLTMDFVLHENAARLTVTHAFHNLRDTPRRLAAWVINAVEAEGFGLTAWRQDTRRSLILFHDTAPRAAAVRAEPAVLAVDYRIPPQTSFCKVGTDTACGWGAFVWDGMALKSSVAHVAGAEYPEGGGTVTFFNSGPMDGSRFGEVENAGPLTDVPPGGSVQMVQTLTLIGGLAGDDLAAWADQIAGANLN
jgi:hypothetical protein